MVSRLAFPAVLLTAWSGVGVPASGAEIARVEPDLVLAANAAGEGGTQVAIVGSGFERSCIARLGGVRILDQTFVDATRITGRVPALAPGFYAVDLLGPTGGPVASLAGAVEVTEPVAIASVSPSVLPRAGGIAVVVAGRNFRAGTAISGVAPALSAGEPDGAYDVVAEDSRGRAILPGGVVYETPIALEAVEPRLVSTAGGTPVVFRGSGFQAGDLATIGGEALVSPEFLDPTRIRGRTPPLAAGFHLAAVVRPGGPAARLDRAVEAAPPPAI